MHSKTATHPLLREQCAVTGFRQAVSLTHQGNVTLRALYAPAGHTGCLFDGVAALGADAFRRRVAAPLPAAAEGGIGCVGHLGPIGLLSS